MKTAAHPALKAHVWRFAFIAFSLLGVHQDLQAKESSGMQWTVTRHTWGEDLSGSRQGAGGIGGLLRSTVVAAVQDGKRNTEHEQTFSYDSNGNVILLTNAKAQETARYSYDAFGRTLTAIGPAAEQNRYQFSTKPVEEESRLVYYGYRWYDPITGRWPSRDPIGERGGVNLYSAIENAPLNSHDILGLNCGCWGAVVCFAAVTLATGTFTATITACVLCVIPGDGVIIGDIAQCAACFAGIPGTILAADGAISACENCDPNKADEMRALKNEVETLRDELNELRDYLGI
jgi:RHS repeat-associated protein